MNWKHALIGLIAFSLIATTLPAGAYSESVITRSQDNADFNPATQGTPLFEITQYGPIYGGTNGQDFITVTNNYDEQLSTTLTLSQGAWSFTSTGTNTQTVTLQPGESVTLQVDTTGQSQDCTQQQTTMTYDYSVSGTTLSIQQTTESITFCGSGGGGGGEPPVEEPPGGGGTPPANSP